MGDDSARRAADLPQLGPSPAAPDLRRLPDRERPLIVVDSHLADGAERTLADDVLDGLTRPFKELPPKHFYDARGSELFEAITALPEYYPTRTERGLLAAEAGRIADGAVELVELGSGSAAKARLLLAAGGIERYVPLDVSEAMLRDSAAELAREYPGLEVHGVVGDFERHLDRVPAATGPRVVAFLGGTIGNFPPGTRRRLLRRIAALLGPEDRLLLGAGLVTDVAVMEAAYDDPGGVTAEFNRNVLHVLNRELGADFAVERYEHHAFYDRRREWIEMRLRSVAAQTVRIPALDLQIELAAGEEIRTEISAKFTRRRLAADFAAAGLDLAELLTDPDGRFALALGRVSRL